ncbi:hypothetical protein BdWA1_001409 [Babesia duncani]|uniref:Uncharacterized protein n=1 Tax=Babesia duncani TaxID=323732 RepID=A0AAD9PPE6_9APIC|nr:hypothetical protein BdWA1_001409 [Babesia duncani]
MGKRSKARHKGMGKNRKLKRGIRDLKHRSLDIDQIHKSVFGLSNGEKCTNVKFEMQGDGTLILLNDIQECSTVNFAIVILWIKIPLIATLKKRAINDV